MDEAPNPDAYREFLKGIEILNVRLDKLSVSRRGDLAGKGTVTVKCGSAVKDSPPGRLMVGFDTIVDGKTVPEPGASEKPKRIFRISSSFVLTYAIPETGIPNEMLELFVERNVLVNVWPYVRELTHSLTMRMGIPPVVLDLQRV